jgi:hypothetical protein
MILKPPPERIYGWLDSQLSVARFYGAIDLQGHRYVIAEDEPDQPLVRLDVRQAEAKAAKQASKAKRQDERAKALQAQAPLVDLLADLSITESSAT